MYLQYINDTKCKNRNVIITFKFPTYFLIYFFSYPKHDFVIFNFYNKKDSVKKNFKFNTTKDSN